MLRKAQEFAEAEGIAFFKQSNDAIWKRVMLTPYDFDAVAVHNEKTRSIMETIFFEHGGKEYDEKYPDGIPTSVHITMKDGAVFDSGLVMYPAGHARNVGCDLEDILRAKFAMHGQIAMDNPSDLINRCSGVGLLDSNGIQNIWDIAIAERPIYKD
jgi:2-methylcitrate dehydratase